MFKKRPVIKPATPLRSSDRRKLADKLIRDFQIQTPVIDGHVTSSISSSLRNRVLPENVLVAKFTTTQGPHQRVVHGNLYIGSLANDALRILWFEIHARMFPTVYTLWNIPNMIALLHTPGAVITKLQNGADLMVPGLATGPPFPSRATKDAIVAISSVERPSVPMAVGVCIVDVASFTSIEGLKGVAVEIEHWIGDELWEYCPSGRAGPSQPSHISEWSSGLSSNTVISSDQMLDRSHKADVAHVETNLQPSGTKEMGEPSSEQPTLLDCQLGDHTVAKQWSQSEIDSAFRCAFLFGIYQAVKDHPEHRNHGLVFPLSQSMVMSNLVQPFLPVFHPRDVQFLHIRKTSWKNLRKFVKSLDKDSIVKCKDRDSNETVIVDIDFDSEAVKSFRPYSLPSSRATRVDADSTNPESTGVYDASVGQKLEVFTFYKISTKFSFLMQAAHGTSYCSASDVRSRIEQYIESERLMETTNTRLVHLNATLCDALYAGTSSLDKEVVAKGIIPRNVLIDRIFGGLPPVHVVSRNDDNPLELKSRSGPPPRVNILVETRGGNKTVTRVSGLEAFYISARPLAEELRKACAGSTSVEPLLGAAKRTEKEVLEVMVQGSHSQSVIEALCKRGVRRQWIELIDQVKAKKR